MIFATYLLKIFRNKVTEDKIERTFSSGIHPDYRLDIIASIYCLQASIKARTFELLSDIGHFFVDPLFFQFLHPCASNIRNKLVKIISMISINISVIPYLREPTHIGRHFGIVNMGRVLENCRRG
jgi:hypothetical protein